MSLKEQILEKKNDKSVVTERPPYPKVLKLDVCNVCNYSCVFCPQAKQAGHIGNIDHELCLKILKDNRMGGGTRLCLAMRGEPLLNPHFEEYVRYAKELGYSYVFTNTNGYLMDRDRGKKLLEAGLDSVKVSVNAASSSYALVHGIDGWEKVRKNIMDFDMLRKSMGSDCKLFISYVAVKQTLEEIAIVQEELRPYVDEIVTMNANTRAGSIGEVEGKLYAGDDEYTMTFPCSQLFNTVNVTAEGYMITCCQDFDNLGVLADLNNIDIVSAWNCEAFVDFRRSYLRKQWGNTLCHNCMNGVNDKVVPITENCTFYKTNEKKIKNMNDRIEQLDTAFRAR